MLHCHLARPWFYGVSQSLPPVALLQLMFKEKGQHQIQYIEILLIEPTALQCFESTLLGDAGCEALRTVLIAVWG